jgi:hypothetical protein
MFCVLSRVRHSILLPQKRSEIVFLTAFLNEIDVVATLVVAILKATTAMVATTLKILIKRILFNKIKSFVQP